MQILDRRVHLITGKGGVGRTSVTAGLALAIARRGKRVLALEIGDPEGGHSALGRTFGHDKLDETPRPVAPGVHACQLWAPTGHESFLRSVLPSVALVKAALRSKALQKFLVAAPSFHEMGIFYHLLSMLRARHGGPGSQEPQHEALLIDMPATGHALALTSLPDILLRLVPGGVIADAMREGQACINNPEETSAWIVTLPEQLPISESIELLDGLRETRVPVGGFLLNRYPDEPFDEDEGAALEERLAQGPLRGQRTWRRIQATRRSSERLHRSVDLPVFTLPEFSEPVERAVAKKMPTALLGESAPGVIPEAFAVRDHLAATFTGIFGALDGGS